MMRTHDTVTGGIHTRRSTPTIGIPFTRPERERRLDTSATCTDE